MILGKKELQLVIGAGIVAVLGGIYFGLHAYNATQAKKEEAAALEKQESDVVLSIGPGTVKSITFDGEKGKVELTQKEDTWVSSQDSAFQGDKSRINVLLGDLQLLSATRTISDTNDLEEFGLGSDRKEITVTMQDATSQVLYVGNRNDSTGEVYFQLADTPDKVYLTTTALDTHFAGSLETFASYEECPRIQPKYMRVFEVQGKAENYTLTMPGDDTCSVTDANGQTQSASLGAVGAAQENLGNINWVHNIAYNCGDFNAYGLGDTAAIIDITFAMDESGDLYKTRLSVGDLDENGDYYVRLNDSKQVHTIHPEYLEGLVEVKATAFWSNTYSFVSIGDMKQLKVRYKGADYVLTREAENEGKSDEKIAYFVNGKQVSRDAFTGFYYACVSVTAQERLTEIPQHSKEPVMTLCYTLTDDTIKEISYYEYDQNFYTVLYDRGESAGHTNKLYVNAMLEALEKLLTEI